MPDKYEFFTPGVPIQYEGAKAIQRVDGQKRVLYPPNVPIITKLQRDGMSDEDIAGWLDMMP